MAAALPLVTAERNAAKTQIQVARPPWLRNNLTEGEGEMTMKALLILVTIFFSTNARAQSALKEASH